MYPWFRIKKRTGNANWHGKDLGAVTPEIAIDIVNEAPPQPVAKPIPKMPACLIKPQPANVKWKRS